MRLFEKVPGEPVLPAPVVRHRWPNGPGWCGTGAPARPSSAAQAERPGWCGMPTLPAGMGRWLALAGRGRPGDE